MDYSHSTSVKADYKPIGWTNLRALLLTLAMVSVPSLTVAVECSKESKDPKDMQEKEKATEDADKSAKVSVLDALALGSSGKSMLATTQLARVFSPISMGSPKTTIPALGFDLTSSLPVENASFLDYARHQLLLRRGGVVNLYTSLTFRNPCNVSSELLDFRLSELDRTYFNRDSPGDQKALGFWSHGLGARIIKTELPGEKTAGMFTAYLGIGVDGPLFEGEVNSKTPPGVFSLEGFVSYNMLNKRTLKEMFALPDEQKDYATYGINFRFNLPGSFQIKLEHLRGLGSFGKNTLGDLTPLSVAYKKPD
jgi:hypothetical protein